MSGVYPLIKESEEVREPLESSVVELPTSELCVELFLRRRRRFLLLGGDVPGVYSLIKESGVREPREYSVVELSTSELCVEVDASASLLTES